MKFCFSKDRMKTLLNVSKTSLKSLRSRCFIWNVMKLWSTFTKRRSNRWETWEPNYSMLKNWPKNSTPTLKCSSKIKKITRDWKTSWLAFSKNCNLSSNMPTIRSCSSKKSRSILKMQRGAFLNSNKNSNSTKIRSKNFKLSRVNCQKN